MKCLITGGAGFIGSHLCDSMISKGYEVYCLDNLSTGDRRNIAHLLSHKNFHFSKLDLTSPLPADFTDNFNKLDFIYHLASPASPPHYQRLAIETLMVNSYGTYQILNLAKKFNSRFLLASTSEVYGDPLVHPQKESYYGNVNPHGVRACYDEAKRFAEAITMEYYRKFRLDARISRIFNTYGPRMSVTDGRVISNFITQALSGKKLTIYGDGMQTRSFSYISDLIDGLIKFMEIPDLQSEVINLGYPEEHTVNEIAHSIQNLTKTKNEIVYLEKKSDDPVRRKPDITKAKKLLNWQPHTGLHHGLLETIAYFQNL
ncbi:NAD-dependent dehydratase [Candidatus Gottesmanbacteria bacterium RIFCSPHIGHO2_02_FULL_40_13]|uniref:UDP-glucuronate decarboxylase n=1 Tax=Candidatus Gottesmanbacteria bacterium RIFCSPHIGHO2_02_FULL_40_13 TaxID=1798384 RepID=A0A1F6AB85_9BACT|nr:MAG: NAD-dependent dehydratase [Candidatus Gottesmanbacteria bacterium RIFCSPHIGHO2_02_FULL_40_13]